MPDDFDNFAKLRRDVVSICRRDDVPSDSAYWRERTPEERLEYMEFLRQVNYDYDPASDRIQRVLEIAKREWG